jgi:hypothetical protein
VAVIALVGDDGFGPVVWGLGATLEEAEADAHRWGDEADTLLDISSLEAHEITEAQAAVVKLGIVSWPIVVEGRR